MVLKFLCMAFSSIFILSKFSISQNCPFFSIQLLLSCRSERGVKIPNPLFSEMPSLHLTSVALLQDNNNRCIKIVNTGIHLLKKKGVVSRLFCLCFKMSCVTSDESQHLWGIEKLFHSLWKEMAGRALCLLSVPSHRESHGSGWKGLMGDRPPAAAWCWLIPAGRVWAGSMVKSAQGHCARGRVCLQWADKGRWHIVVCLGQVPPQLLMLWWTHRVYLSALGGLLSASQSSATAW